MSAIGYRRDIDGLRAIAVTAVILYHYGIGRLSGGFVGVDVFFVISGFLITSIIHREVVVGQFTFSRFYLRRIERIFPALIAVLLVVMAVGPLILLPSDLRILSSSVLSTLAFSSNIFFWRQSGYFDSSAELSPVLHTWSLGVEEQFYIFFPLLIIAVERIASRYLPAILLAIFFVSLIGCVYLQASHPSLTFYLSPFRAWELALGGLLAIGTFPPIRKPAAREAIAAFAAFVLLCSLWWVQAGVRFPGWQATIPVAATAALIHTGGEPSTFVHRTLSLRPVVWIGLLSYSLYLWHWPLLVYLRYHGGLVALNGWQKLALVAMVTALSWVSYRWIESPFRGARRKQLGRSKPRIMFRRAAIAMGALAVLALALRLNNGWEGRVAPAVLALDNSRNPVIPFKECDGRDPGDAAPNCVAGEGNRGTSSLLWGDSHALAWSPAFSASSGPTGGQRTTLAIKSACPPLLDVKINSGSECAVYSARVFDWIKRHRPRMVFLVASWMDYSRAGGLYDVSDRHRTESPEQVFREALRRTVLATAPYTDVVVLIGPTPGAPIELPFKMAMAAKRGTPPPEPLSAMDFRRRSAAFWRAAALLSTTNKLQVIDPSPWLCNTNYCAYQHEGRLLYRDNGHLNLDGANFIAPYAAEEIRYQMARRGSGPVP